MIQCEFLEKKFKITKEVARLIGSIELETAIDYNEQETHNGLPQLEIKGYKPQSFTIEYTAATAAGANPMEEYRAWKKKLGKAGEFYLGENQLGIDVFTLKSLALNDAKVNARGDFLSGTISLGLSQDIAAGG
jgi:hypothetical protein